MPVVPLLIRRPGVTLRQLQRKFEASRREMRLHDQIAYHGSTWTSAHWKRQIRYATRLYRVAHGMSPWRKHNGF